MFVKRYAPDGVNLWLKKDKPVPWYAVANKPTAFTLTDMQVDANENVHVLGSYKENNVDFMIEMRWVVANKKTVSFKQTQLGGKHDNSLRRYPLADGNFLCVRYNHYGPTPFQLGNAFRKESEGIVVSKESSAGKILWRKPLNKNSQSGLIGRMHVLSCQKDASGNLLIVDGRGLAFSLMDGETIGNAPLARATLKQTSRSSFTFNGQASYDPDGSAIKNWHWEFGDGSSAQGANVSHTYTQAGAYSVRLLVCDGAGDYGYTDLSIMVNDEGLAGKPPIGEALNAKAQNGVPAPLSLTFNNPDNWPTGLLFPDAPKHGRILFNNDRTKAYYLSDDSFTGTDTFSWKPNPASAERAVTVTVLDAGHPLGRRVEIICRNDTYKQFGAKVDRLLDDLRNEGWTPGLTMWTKGFSHEATPELRDLMISLAKQPGKEMSGAILIGELPVKYREHPSTAGSDADQLLSYELYQAGAHIWFSRIMTNIGPELDANHRFRTGKTRLPYHVYDNRDYYQGQDPDVLETWPNHTIFSSDPGNTGGTAGATAGSHFVVRCAHNVWGIKGTAKRAPIMTFIAAAEGCGSGKWKADHDPAVLGSPKSPAVLYLHWSSGLIRLTGKKEHRTLLQKGASIGEALMARHTERGPMFSRYHNRISTFHLGDLTLRPVVAPHNDMPRPQGIKLVTKNPVAGQTVSLSCTVTDKNAASEDSPHSDVEFTAEWRMNLTTQNTWNVVDPDVIQTTQESTPTFIAKHNWSEPNFYDIQCLVGDEWNAWQAVRRIVGVAPDMVNSSWRVAAGSINEKVHDTAGKLWQRDRQNNPNCIGGSWYIDGYNKKRKNAAERQNQHQNRLGYQRTKTFPNRTQL